MRNEVASLTSISTPTTTPTSTPIPIAFAVEEIAHPLANHTLADARALFAASTGAKITVSGVLLKKAKRDGLRLVIRTEASGRSFEIYANFNDEAEQQRFLGAKVKKNRQVTVARKLGSFGSAAIVLNDCRWEL